MSSKVRIVPYKQSSHGARLLANALTDRLGYKVFRGPYRIGRANIHWGNPGGANASKLDTLRILESVGVSIPEYTTSREKALEWIQSGCKVVCRTLLRASEGRGIVIASTADQIVSAPLYVKYIKKKKEFRVHVLGGTVILIQEKRKRRGAEVDYQVRNHGDWVFCTKDVVEPADLRMVGHNAVLAVCPDTISGAVDVIYNEHQNKCYVLEVNSAPGLTPSTAAVYADYIKGEVDKHA